MNFTLKNGLIFKVWTTNTGANFEFCLFGQENIVLTEEFGLHKTPKFLDYENVSSRPTLR